MSFTPDTLDALVASNSNRRAIWTYTNTDAHADIDADDYFALMGAPARTSKGMKLYDILIYIDTDTATCTIHYVREVDAAGNVSVSIATLS